MLMSTHLADAAAKKVDLITFLSIWSSQNQNRIFASVAVLSDISNHQMTSSPNSSGYSKSILSAIKDLEWKRQEEKKHAAGFTVSALLTPANMSIAPLLGDSNEESSSKADFPAPSINEFQEHKQRVQRSLEETKPIKAQSLNQVHLSEVLPSTDCKTEISVSSSSQSLDNTSEKDKRASSRLSSDFSKDSIVEIPFSVCAEALYACAFGEIASLKQLIKQYPTLVNYAYPHCYRQTCLHIAAKSGDFSLVKYLVQQGADVNPKDDNWSTPAHLAAKTNNVEMIGLLRVLGADLNATDGYGNTYEHYLNERTCTEDRDDYGSSKYSSFSLSHSFQRMVR
uniref:Uncharacterized protein n=1 Tax=Ditylenchus dipsaci TaxID=166011 RepID=A0A915D4C5_9BILA